ncbi:hypothetical protein CBW46_004825 [Paenibacillus xerothermodurans]|uniref:N-acetyltransferase n=1 Tax=Paenibacillus xerothermodurans TaxID=1977292 RepID=A0A2W1P1W7_PAEXE|nr:hypothetical protein CBW46_004825 [Paenibacillus xerothermodurans]
MIELALKTAADLGYGVLLLIGAPGYYPKFGFLPARAHALDLQQFKVPDNVFMVREIRAGQLAQIKGRANLPTGVF